MLQDSAISDVLADALSVDTQNTGLDRNTLSICVSLIENGVNPEALAVRSDEDGGGNTQLTWLCRL